MPLIVLLPLTTKVLNPYYNEDGKKINNSGASALKGEPDKTYADNAYENVMS